MDYPYIYSIVSQTVRDISCEPRFCSGELAPDTTLENMGMDGRDIMEVICRLEKFFQVSFPDVITEKWDMRSLVHLAEGIVRNRSRGKYG